MGKLRKIAKNLKNQSKHKKDIANFLADVDFHSKLYNVREMLVNGHRGYMAHSTEDLTSMFDNVYEKIAKGELMLKEYTRAVRHRADEYELNKKFIDRADKIYDEIFEKLVLTS